MGITRGTSSTRDERGNAHSLVLAGGGLHVERSAAVARAHTLAVRGVNANMSRGDGATISSGTLSVGHDFTSTDEMHLVGTAFEGAVGELAPSSASGLLTHHIVSHITGVNQARGSDSVY